ncbi:hypothetical protein FHL15_003000 [Xylaria flabelliformis]|uniref:Spo12-like protein n=1 Tax=Xylaria flabelliformis TaxID=2512241 RepID=A0A553I7U9_9PEZI|nr:hypothetical protein FHL15_003000 [Xylaria flabelliformis]
MGPANALSEKDANTSLNQAGTGANKADIKSMEYHRQVFKSKMEEEKYGHTATNTAFNPAVGASPGSGLGTMTVISAAVKPSLASSSSPLSLSSQMIIHRKTLAGLPADPDASGTCSSKQQYVSPSDNIMSPCTAKLHALKSRHAAKVKPKSLFAQASAKKFVGEELFGARNAEPASSTNDNQQTG